MEPWCNMGTDLIPLRLAGRMRVQEFPDTLYGMLGALLFRSGRLGQELSDSLAHDGFPMPEGPFRLMILALDDPLVQQLEGWKRNRCRINLYDHLRQRLLDQIGDDATGFLFMQLGYLLGIFYEEARPDAVAQVCQDAVDYARDEIGISIHVTVSNLWEGVEAVEAAYRTVQDVEQARNFYTDTMPPVFVVPKDTMARLVDRDQRSRFEQTFLTAADRICGTVRAGDTEAAAQRIREQLLKIAENCIGLPYPTTLNMTLNRFMSVLQYRLAEEDLADWRYLAERDFCRELISMPTLEEFLTAGEPVAQALVQHANQRMDAQHDRLMHDIRDFLEENATDVNIGLTSVAREFHIKPREVAESFRQYYGVSVNDIIHRARVKKAKELILTTNDSIQSIAEAVGYCSLATMYRAFTNVEGVAPGKLRQNRGG